jgi:TolB protein
MNADGSNPARLTRMHTAMRPVWSRDGKRIAFSSNAQGAFCIYVIDADGANLTRLPLADGFEPAWSPDGKQIAFEKLMGVLDVESKIFVAARDGRDPVRITSGVSNDSNPVWSPDGREIAFDSNRDGNLEIYILKIAGP